MLLGASETVVFADATVRTINGKQVTLDGLSGSPSATTEYSIRRKLETVNSSGAPLIYGNDIITADIQNLYTEKENCYYVAASSLPSYTLTKNLDQAIITSLVSTNLQEFDTNKLSTSTSILDILKRMIPTNPISALASGDILGVIFFAIFFGIMMNFVDVKYNSNIKDLINSVYEHDS